MINLGHLHYNSLIFPHAIIPEIASGLMKRYHPTRPYMEVIWECVCSNGYAPRNPIPDETADAVIEI